MHLAQFWDYIIITVPTLPTSPNSKFLYWGLRWAIKSTGKLIFPIWKVTEEILPFQMGTNGVMSGKESPKAKTKTKEAKQSSHSFMLAIWGMCGTSLSSNIFGQPCHHAFAVRVSWYLSSWLLHSVPTALCVSGVYSMLGSLEQLRIHLHSTHIAFSGAPPGESEPATHSHPHRPSFRVWGKLACCWGSCVLHALKPDAMWVTPSSAHSSSVGYEWWRLWQWAS